MGNYKKQAAECINTSTALTDNDDFGIEAALQILASVAIYRQPILCCVITRHLLANNATVQVTTTHI